MPAVSVAQPIVAALVRVLKKHKARVIHKESDDGKIRIYIEIAAEDAAKAEKMIFTD
jgi:hypothetical protein